jgi:hypothetical protein
MYYKEQYLHLFSEPDLNRLRARRAAWIFPFQGLIGKFQYLHLFLEPDLNRFRTRAAWIFPLQGLIDKFHCATNSQPLTFF